MNYYEHHLGDYMRDTAHLSMLEDAAYRRLLDAYYIREKPLPLNAKECFKLVRAASKADRDAVLYVLKEFFEEREDGHHQRRADSEIARFHDKSAKAKASIEKRWERVRNENERSTDVSDSNIRTYNEGNTPRARPQTPDTRHQRSKESSLRLEVETRSASLDLPPPPEGDGEAGTPAKACPYQQIVALYHSLLPTCRQVEKLTDTRKGYIRQRWLDDLPTLDAWRNYFTDVSTSKFLTGRAEARDNKPPFVADLEWLTRPGNFAKVAEGKYHR